MAYSKTRGLSRTYLAITEGQLSDVRVRRDSRRIRKSHFNTRCHEIKIPRSREYEPIRLWLSWMRRGFCFGLKPYQRLCFSQGTIAYFAGD